jgi:predicted ATPase
MKPYTLETVSIEDFKSYKSGTLNLSPLTVMIGANASGKSNAIEALRFVSWLAQGQKLTAIQYSVNSDEKFFRGNSNNIPRSNTKCFGFSCLLDGDPNLRWNIKIEMRKDGLHIIDESLHREGEAVALYSLDQPSSDRNTDVRVSYNNFARGGRKPQVTCTDQLPVFLQLASPSIFSNSQKAERLIPETVTLIEAILSGIVFLDPNPQKMRDYSFPTDTKLHGDGANLSAVLYNICGQPKEGNFLAKYLTGESDHGDGFEILNFIKSLPEQNIESIGFIIEPRGGVMVTLTESFGGVKREFDASLLSDGTLRMLSIVAALLSAQPGALVVIEEIDNGVHPSRAQHLLKSIRSIAESRQLRVLMSTHNPALLDALPDESLGDVVFCYRSNEDGTSKLLRLSDSESYVEILSQGSLGNLLTDGVIDRYAKLPPDKSQKKAIFSSWLASIR